MLQDTRQATKVKVVGGRTKVVRGPHAARGPRFGPHWTTSSWFSYGCPVLGSKHRGYAFHRFGRLPSTRIFPNNAIFWTGFSQTFAEITAILALCTQTGQLHQNLLRGRQPVSVLQVHKALFRNHWRELQMNCISKYFGHRKVANQKSCDVRQSIQLYNWI